MRILFCKISAMKFYKGVIPGKDEAFNGGSFVKEHGEGNEQYNFAPVISEDGQAYCLGFVETKSSSKGKHNDDCLVTEPQRKPKTTHHLHVLLLYPRPMILS